MFRLSPLRTGIPVHLDHNLRERDLRILKEGILLDQLLSVKQPVAQYLQTAWHRVVEDYSQGHLPSLADRAVAIEGVASRISTVTGDEYVTGTWRKQIPQNFCWMRDRSCERLEMVLACSFRAPDWSWLGLPFPMKYTSSKATSSSSWETETKIRRVFEYPLLFIARRSGR